MNYKFVVFFCTCICALPLAGAHNDVKNKCNPKQKKTNFYLSCAALDSTESATCQSSNKLGYSSGSANDSAALGLTWVTVNVYQDVLEPSKKMLI